MKNIINVLGFLWAALGVAQNISKLYDLANESVVLIKTLQPEMFGQGKMKTMVTLEGLESESIFLETGTFRYPVSFFSKKIT